jgi:predicted TPR repeat methyltransferase
VALADKKEHKDSLESFNKAIEIKPDYVTALFRRSVVKSVLGDENGATEDMKQVAKLGFEPAQKLLHEKNISWK